MSLRFKFILCKPDEEDEVHIWVSAKPSKYLELKDIVSAAMELFVFPSGSRLIFTMNDGEDDITISSTHELQQLVKDHIESTANTRFAKNQAMRLRLCVKQPDLTVTESGAVKEVSFPCNLQTSISEHSKEHVDTGIQMSVSTEQLKCHFNVVCDGCNGDVCRIRYKCFNCPDYDLCEKCFHENKHEEHQFIAIRHGITQHIQHIPVYPCVKLFPVSNINTLGSQTVDASINNVVAESSDIKILVTPSNNGAEEWDVLSDNSDSDFVLENESVEAVIDSSIHTVTHNADVGTVAQYFDNCKITQPVEMQPKQLNVRGVTCELSRPLIDSTLEPLKVTHSVFIPTTSDSNAVNVDAVHIPQSSDAFVHVNLPSSNESQTQQAWDLQTSMQNFLADAWRNLGFNKKTGTSIEELQILLDKGYSNEGGILTFLLSENHNNAAAVLEILRHQS